MEKISLWPKIAVDFFREAYSELQKVNWLSRKDVVRATIGVAFVVLIVAIYVSSMDWILSKLVRSIIGGR